MRECVTSSAFTAQLIREYTSHRSLYGYICPMGCGKQYRSRLFVEKHLLTHSDDLASLAKISRPAPSIEERLRVPPVFSSAARSGQLLSTNELLSAAKRRYVASSSGVVGAANDPVESGEALEDSGGSQPLEQTSMLLRVAMLSVNHGH